MNTFTYKIIQRKKNNTNYTQKNNYLKEKTKRVNSQTIIEEYHFMNWTSYQQQNCSTQG